MFLAIMPLMDQMLPTPSQELPIPNSGESQPTAGGSEYHIPRPEVAKSHDTQERVSQAVSAVAQANDDVASAVADDSQSISIPTPVQDDTSSIGPQAADNNDVIEKEWVNGARQIVKETKHDPQDQADKITRFKHDYIKKRFGKEIKLPEDNSDIRF